MLLDTYNTVYIWIGNKSNKFEKNGSIKAAAKYIDNIKDNRVKDDVNIVEVDAGKEPSSFSVYFTDWRSEVAKRWLLEDPLLKEKEIKE